MPEAGWIEIASKRDGFRRGGIAHSRIPVRYPLDRFSAEQLAAIRAEPMLVVREEENPAVDPAVDGQESSSPQETVTAESDGGSTIDSAATKLERSRRTRMA